LVPACIGARRRELGPNGAAVAVEDSLLGQPAIGAVGVDDAGPRGSRGQSVDRRGATTARANPAAIAIGPAASIIARLVGAVLAGKTLIGERKAEPCNVGLHPQ